MRKHNHYQKEKFFGFCSAGLVIIIFLSTLIYLTYILGNNPTPALCTFTFILLSIARIIAAMAASLSTYFFISYFDAIGTIYIGRGDKPYFQAVGAIVSFLFIFFFIFYNIRLPEQC